MGMKKTMPREKVLKRIIDNSLIILNGEGLLGYILLTTGSSTGYYLISLPILALVSFSVGGLGLLLLWDDLKNEQQYLSSFYKFFNKKPE